MAPRATLGALDDGDGTRPLELMSRSQESGHSLRVTSIGPHIPHPAIAHAGGRFLHAHLAHLANSFEVTAIAPGTPENLAALASPTGGVRAHAVPLGSPVYQQLQRVVRYPGDVLGGLTPGGHVLAAVRRDEKTRESIRGSDLIELQWPQWLPLVEEVRSLAPDALVVAVEHDVLTQSLHRRVEYSTSPRIRLTSRIRLRRVPTQERVWLDRCDATLVFSDKDAEFLRGLGVRTRIDVVPPHVDWPTAPVGPSEAPTVLFVGAMWRPENVEAAQNFRGQSWPAVRAAVPDAALRIAGDRPPRSVQSSSADGVTVTGFVPDLDEEYRRARVVIAPGRSSAGVNFKVLQAMAHRLPVVASPECAEGITAIVGDDAFLSITDDPGATARAVIEALQDPARATQLGRLAEERLSSWRKSTLAERDVATLYRELVEHANRARERDDGDG